ncbi:MAG: hypothetical protein IKN44_05450 [Bacteroidaceae bacterium]|nr:hypothetical protein [Bacteroidaceae bacterium]
MDKANEEYFRKAREKDRENEEKALALDKQYGIEDSISDDEQSNDDHDYWRAMNEERDAYDDFIASQDMASD